MPLRTVMAFELATSNINAMIYRKEKLLEKAPATP